MYHPNVKNTDPTTVQFKYKEVYIESEKDIKLKSWFSYLNPNKKTILFFHGNAGELGARTYKLNKFNDLDLNFLIISWRDLVVIMENQRSRVCIKMLKKQLNGLRKKE